MDYVYFYCNSFSFEASLRHEKEQGHHFLRVITKHAVMDEMNWIFRASPFPLAKGLE
ncbi:hypothetical protein TNIN_301471, partial [Trichonephila inaurata madagascariensis]